MICHRCGKELRDGDAAYEQDERTIDVRGTRVTFDDHVVVVCEACAEEEDSS